MSGGWTIRRMRQSEYALLPELLLKAIYLPEGTPPPPFEAVFSPELLPYTVGFGAGAYDRALCAVVRGTVIGAVWVRLVRVFGYLDDATPELVLVVEEPFRGRGIGTELLRRMLLLAADEGVQHLSLSVQRANPPGGSTCAWASRRCGATAGRISCAARRRVWSAGRATVCGAGWSRLQGSSAATRSRKDKAPEGRSTETKGNRAGGRKHRPRTGGAKVGAGRQQEAPTAGRRHGAPAPPRQPTKDEAEHSRGECSASFFGRE